jgi:NCS1 family nucleobase:cation symporter-1
MSPLKIQRPPEWGIEPVPPTHRIMGFIDYFALWSSLGVGLLVFLAGSLLVPGLGLKQAFLAILLGTVVGNILLALAGYVGSREAIPTMVLLRPVLGIRGSYIPTLLNILQLIGWGAFEVIIMAQAASQISQKLFGFSAFVPWVAFFSIWCTLMAIGGPLMVVRDWIEKFAIWLVYGITIYLTWYLFSHYDITALWRKPGTGELTFLIGVDLVIAMPISWMPLVADYNRFARKAGSAFWGTYLGYLVANVWFYALGALFILALGTQDLIPAILSLAGGMIALILILVDETDNAFADIYSAAVSAQNIIPKVPQWVLVTLVGLICLILGAKVPIDQYKNFLLLIGSVFVPLFGVLAAHYFFVEKGRYRVEEIYQPKGRYWYAEGFNWKGLVAWALGIATYHAVVKFIPWLGASIPSFVVAFLAHWVLNLKIVIEARKVAYAVVLTALVVVFSPFYVPVGITKIQPAQHMINVIAAVLVGPWYALAVATAAAIIRNALNLGTIFAFPGGMIGAFLAGWAYRLSRNIYLAALAEVIGTGLIASTLSALVIGPVFLKKTMALGTFILAFSASTIAGSILGVLILLGLKRAGFRW